MATKLNSNALVNQSIEEEKLASGVQTKLNKESIPDAPDSKDYVRNKGQWKEFAGVEEAPIDDKAYVRKNAGWEKYDYPPIEEPIIREVTAIGENTIQVPPLCHYCEAFLVNGGNAGWYGSKELLTLNMSKGGAGGYTQVVVFEVTPLDDISVFIGKGGLPGSMDHTYKEPGTGETTKITYRKIIYSPKTQDKVYDTNEGNNGRNGILNPLNPNDTNLYGACGGGGWSEYMWDEERASTMGGATGGGKGGAIVHYDFDDSWYAGFPDDGSFYGAGGGGGSYTVSDKATNGASGYQGYAYLKFY